MKITIVGSGYVGLVSGACLAELGHSVCCVDVDTHKIEDLQNGIIPIYEPGLAELIAKNQTADRLAFSSDLAPAVKSANAVLIAVGTPPGKDGSADLQYVVGAAREIAGCLERYTIIIIKSTVPVGTGSMIEETLSAEVDPNSFDIVSNPEFLREGAAISDFMKPDRIVIGTENSEALKIMQEVYEPLTNEGIPLVCTNRKTSELIKYAANAFLATKISFINEISDLCEKVGANISGVAEGMGLDSRIGPKFLNAGPGYGGSCFPKDTIALLKTAEESSVNMKIVEAAVEVNHNRKLAMAQRIISGMGGDITKTKIAVLGLTFKPDTNDLRESPSLVIIPKLQEAGAQITAFDPEGGKEAKNLFEYLNVCDSLKEAIKNVDAVVILTEWEEISQITPEDLVKENSGPYVFDFRKSLNSAAFSRAGFIYETIG